MRKVITFLACICIAHIAVSQDIEFNEKNFPGDKNGLEVALSNYEQGDRFFFQGPPYFDQALSYYLKAYEFNSEYSDLNFKIGKIYKHQNKPHSAEPYFEKAIRLDNNPIHRVEGEITLAEVYHLNGRWDEAIGAYKIYKEWLRTINPRKVHLHTGDLAHEMRWADMRIRQCENGKALTMDTIPILLENMGKGINSEFPDYSAVVNKKEDFIVFTSRRPGSTGEKMPYGEVWQYEDIYYSRRTKEGWQSAVRLPGEVNSENHEAPVWMSATGEKLIIYRPTNNGDLYLSELKDGIWSKLEPLPQVNSTYRETHASISPDGKTIYFTTDNPKYAKKKKKAKTFYNLDIYRITMDEAGKWSDPEPLEELNTEYDEECPFIEPDGKTMYFSSQGHRSIGGFDIFKTKLENGSFSEPRNMGYPINSPYNDVYIFFSEDGKRGYFDSDRRTGIGEKDIYEMFILSAIRIPLVVKIFDAETGELITADVKITENGSKPKSVELTSASTGTFESQLSVFKFFKVTVSAPSYNTFQGTFNTKVTDMSSFDTIVVRYNVKLEKNNEPLVLKGRILDKISHKPVPGEVEVVLGSEKIGGTGSTDGNYMLELPRSKTYSVKVQSGRYLPLQESVQLDTGDVVHDFYLERNTAAFSMNLIYFKTGKSDIADSSLVELQKLLEFMQKNPYTTVEISAHTDNIGSYAINQRLSEKRAGTVAGWLHARGIPRKRITTSGHSYDQPVSTNETPEGRSLNRRVEVTVTDNW